jgi:DNA-binding response OmpR family regulator
MKIFLLEDDYSLNEAIKEIIQLEILKNIKNKNPKTKVLIISANINIDLIREAYILGCDDYIKKPFDLEELIFKINRYEKKNKLIYLEENIVFNLLNKELLIDGNILELTKNEKNLLFLLVENLGVKVSYEQIENFVYQGESKSSDAIRSLIKRVRKKIPKEVIFNSLDEGYFIK